MNDYIELWQHVLDDISVESAEIILIRNPMCSFQLRAWQDKILAYVSGKFELTFIARYKRISPDCS